MALVTTHNEIENQIEVFLENVRKNGSTVGVPLPPETLERLPLYRKHVPSESLSEGSQFTLNSDDSPTTTTTTTTESCFQNYLLPTNNAVDACSADDITVGLEGKFETTALQIIKLGTFNLFHLIIVYAK